MGIGFHHEGCIIAALELLLVDLRHASGKNLASSSGPFVSSEVERHTFGSRGSWFVRTARLALAIRPAKSIWTPMTYQVHIIDGGLARTEAAWQLAAAGVHSSEERRVGHECDSQDRSR